MSAYLCLWWEMIRLCWRRHPGMTALAFSLHLLNTVAFAGVGLALKALVDSAAHGTMSMIPIAAFGAAAAFVVSRALAEFAGTITVHLVDRVGVTAVEPEIMKICAGLEEIDHLEFPDFLDRVTAVRGQGWAIVESAWWMLQSVLVGARVILTILLLGIVDRWLLLLLVCAGVQLWLDRYGKARVSEAEVAVAEDMRLQRSLFDILTNVSTGKEVCVAGVGAELVTRQAATWDRVVRRRTRARIAATLWSTASWAVFSAGYAVGIGFLAAHGGSAGDLVLAVTIGAQLRGVLEIAVHNSAQVVESRRVLDPFRWLRGYAVDCSAQRTGTLVPPDRIREGITLDDVSFGYSGTSNLALDGVSAFLPAGSVVAVVGEYGSGKTTLVKLLAKLYRPSRGSIRVDDVPLAEVDTTAWRAVMSAAFQDFGRYQTSFDEAVRLGDLAAPDFAVSEAIMAADAEGLMARLPKGADTQLGKRFGGVELSEGQWQKVALARACVRRTPLLFVLDEPTASLDAPSEHAIFERYMKRARTVANRTGAVTLIVSHRFSTVADADLILVMSRGRLVESGSHAELLREGGIYADLYSIQANAYTGD